MGLPTHSAQRFSSGRDLGLTSLPAVTSTIKYPAALRPSETQNEPCSKREICESPSRVGAYDIAHDDTGV